MQASVTPNRLAWRQAGQTVAIYLFFGFIWITLAEKVLNLFIGVPIDLARFHTYEGWSYLLVTANLVFFLSYRQFRANLILQQDLKRRNRLYAVLSHVNQAIVRISEPQVLFEECCRIAVGEGAFRMAWVGLAEKAENQVEVVAQAGVKGDYLGKLDILLSDTLRCGGPSGRAFKEEQHVVCNDIAADPCMAPWRDDALRLGYRSSAAFPLRVAGKVRGIFNLYSSEPGFFDDAELELLDELALNIAFALESADREAQRWRAEAALCNSEERFRTIFDSVNDAVFVHDPHSGAILDANRKMCELYGYTHAEALQLDVGALSLGEPPYTQREALEWMERAAEGEPQIFEWRAKDKQGRLFWVEVNMRRATIGGQNRLLVAVRDITERRQVQQALATEKERAQVTLDSIGDAVITTDAASIVQYLNPVAETLTGWTTAEACDHPLAEVFKIVNEETRQPAPDPVQRCLMEGRITGLANHTFLLSRAGREYAIQDSAAPIRGPRGELFGAVLVFRDITEARRLSQTISYQAAHDDLTGLINRREFERRLQRVLHTARFEQTEHVLCYLDLDQFKLINDTCGHVAGDELLRQLSSLLKDQIRRRDTLARLGGDEFGVLMEHCSVQQAWRVADALRTAVERFRFIWEDKHFSIGVSIGLAPLMPASGDISHVLSAADAACYMAKEQGRNRIHIYQPDDAELAQRHGEMQWATRIPRALEEGRFRLFWQPIVAVSGDGGDGGNQHHFELLLRLEDETGHLIAPGAFLASAERYNLSTRLDRWVISAAFEWLLAHPLDLQQLDLCTINLSGHSMSDEAFLTFIIHQFEVTGIPPEKICFEVTETAAIANLTTATHFIKALKARGCCFALDDFGSGLSSFAYLKNLPVDFLKIDGAFVKDIANDPTSCAIVKSINEIGQIMGKQTVAEFVENEPILEKLRQMGVDYAQGYFIGRPQPLKE